MPFPLSPQAIDAITEVITGGPANVASPSIGIYRTGPEIERFTRALNVDFYVSGSRVPSLTDCLIGINNGPEPEKAMTRIIEATADPRDFIQEPDRHKAVVDYLNRVLIYDGFELQQHGLQTRLVEVRHSTPVLEKLSSIAEVINFDSVRRDLPCAATSADSGNRRSNGHFEAKVCRGCGANPRVDIQHAQQCYTRLI